MNGSNENIDLPAMSLMQTPLILISEVLMALDILELNTEYFGEQVVMFRGSLLPPSSSQALVCSSHITQRH